MFMIKPLGNLSHITRRKRLVMNWQPGKKSELCGHPPEPPEYVSLVPVSAEGRRPEERCPLQKTGELIFGAIQTLSRLDPLLHKLRIVLCNFSVSVS